LVSSRRSSFDGRDVYYRVDLGRCADALCATGVALDPALTLAVTSPTPRPRGRRRRVLFLCTGNSARSQMAEALVEELSGHTIQGRSAGSHPKALHPNAVRVMAQRGIAIAGRPVKPLSRFVGSRFDMVITLCDKVREVCPEFPGPPTTAHWSIPDPAASGGSDEETYPAFESVATDLDVRIRSLVARMNAPEGGLPHAC
jgi:protein-tyrosine-phosphatase